MSGVSLHFFTAPWILDLGIQISRWVKVYEELQGTNALKTLRPTKLFAHVLDTVPALLHRYFDLIPAGDFDLQALYELLLQGYKHWV